MKTIKSMWILLVFIVLTDLVFSQPKVELGIKVSRCYDKLMIDFPLSQWETDVFLNSYYGINAELLISFFKNLYLRMEVLQLNKFDYTDGGYFSFFSNPGADLIYNIPLKYRITPLVFAGIKYLNYYNLPEDDLRHYTTPYQINAGLGIQYKHRKNLKIISELQLYNKYISDTRRWAIFDSPYWIMVDEIAILRLNIGVRIEL
jgi:hypothetical protein